MSLDKRLVCGLEGWCSVEELSLELGREYPDVLFALERLKSYGFVCDDDDDRYALTGLGTKLRDIICGH